jgi:catechol 2,3-dioxygenase-like lactoylglutathione lyase family enzyme
LTLPGTAATGSQAEGFGLSSETVMTVKLNHTIVHSRDPAAAADFYSAVFALPAPVHFGPFFDVEVTNEVTLAFLSAGDMEVQTQHYAFLVSETEFDQIFARVKERGLPYWADPHRRLPPHRAVGAELHELQIASRRHVGGISPFDHSP